jgi:hypothetical protein
MSESNHLQSSPGFGREVQLQGILEYRDGHRRLLRSFVRPPDPLQLRERNEGQAGQLIDM